MAEQIHNLLTCSRAVATLISETSYEIKYTRHCFYQHPVQLQTNSAELCMPPPHPPNLNIG